MTVGGIARLRSWSVAAIVATMFSASASEIGSYQVGAAGWSFEQFGSDVAVLRSPPSKGLATVGVFLSCSGPDRRVRLSFSEPVLARAFHAGNGSLMITPLDRVEHQSAAIGRFIMPDASTILISEAASMSHDIVLTIARMLLARPRGLDVVISSGSGPVALARLVVYRLGVNFGAEDTVAAGHFLSSCHRASVGSAD